MGRRRLKGDKVRLLGRHDGVAGRIYGLAWAALVGEFGPPPPGSLLRLELARTAVAWVHLELATRALAAARRERECGKGRRPSSRDIERLARRAGLADGSYSTALERLQGLVERASKRRGPRALEDLLGRPMGSER